MMPAKYCLRCSTVAALMACVWNGIDPKLKMSSTRERNSNTVIRIFCGINHKNLVFFLKKIQKIEESGHKKCCPRRDCTELNFFPKNN